jgi:insulysin
VPNPDNVNSAIEYFCQVTSIVDTRTRACLHLLSQIGKQKAFDFLRTKLQLGYMIFSGVRDTISTEGLPFFHLMPTDILRYRIIIQSERPPSYLEEKIEVFLTQLRDIIAEMASEDFASHISSLVLSLSEKPKYLGKESFDFWGHIESGFYEFNRSRVPRSNRMANRC